MELPILTPTHLLYAQSALSDDDLFMLLRRNTADLVTILEIASEDQAWCAMHDTFLFLALTSLTDQSFDNRLEQEHVNRVARTIKRHYSLFQLNIPKNIEIKLQDAIVFCNSLLLGAASNFFKQLFLVHQGVREFAFSSVTVDVFSIIQQYVSMENVPELLVMGKEDAISVLRQALHWEVEGLSHECQKIVTKYLTVDNLLSLFIQGKQERWLECQRRCADFIERHHWGFRLHVISLDRLGFEVISFSDETIQYFENFHPMITDLICKNSSVESFQFGVFLRKCPKLVALDFSETQAKSNYLNYGSKELQEINLSECLWVSPDVLKNICEIFPYLKKIALRRNTHLNSSSWGELIKFKQLKCLYLSQCHQIQDEDLSVILKGCGDLTELSLAGCQKINEMGFLELAKGLPHLLSLNVSRSSISNTALVEIASRCRQLTFLDISGCNQLTEKGVNSFMKQAISLIEGFLVR